MYIKNLEAHNFSHEFAIDLLHALGHFISEMRVITIGERSGNFLMVDFFPCEKKFLWNLKRFGIT